MSSRIGPFFAKKIEIEFLCSTYKSHLDFRSLVNDWSKMNMNFPRECVDDNTKKSFLYKQVDRNISSSAFDRLHVHAEVRLIQRM